MKTVNIIYARDKKGNNGQPVKVFASAKEAQEYCKEQNRVRSVLQIAHGVQYIYATYNVE